MIKKILICIFFLLILFGCKNMLRKNEFYKKFYNSNYEIRKELFSPLIKDKDFKFYESGFEKEYLLIGKTYPVNYSFLLWTDEKIFSYSREADFKVILKIEILKNDKIYYTKILNPKEYYREYPHKDTIYYISGYRIAEIKLPVKGIELDEKFKIRVSVLEGDKSLKEYNSLELRFQVSIGSNM